MACTAHIRLRRFGCAEMISLPLAPFLVTSCEGFLADQANTLTMPEGREKINPLLTPVRFGWETVRSPLGKTLSVRELRLFCNATTFFM